MGLEPTTSWLPVISFRTFTRNDENLISTNMYSDQVLLCTSVHGCLQVISWQLLSNYCQIYPTEILVPAATSTLLYLLLRVGFVSGLFRSELLRKPHELPWICRWLNLIWRENLCENSQQPNSLTLPRQSSKVSYQESNTNYKITRAREHK